VSSVCMLFALSDVSLIGMNDILPKPFTKQGLLDMLEVRLSIIPSFRLLLMGGWYRNI
jgi:hypothetical protein